MAKNMRANSEKRSGSSALLHGGVLSQINRRLRGFHGKKHEVKQREKVWKPCLAVWWGAM